MTELVCLRCGNTFAGHGILCPYCVADVKRAEETKSKNKVVVSQEAQNSKEFTFRGLLNSMITIFSIFLLLFI